MATTLTAIQRYPVPPAEVFALFSDRHFLDARLEAGGGLNPQVITLEATDGNVHLVTRQGIPAAALPAAVSSFLSGDPSTQRTETWRGTAEGYTADLKVTIAGAPAVLKGTMTLAPDGGTGSVLTVNADAVVSIPLFGGKLESVIVEQVSELLQREEEFTREQLAD